MWVLAVPAAGGKDLGNIFNRQVRAGDSVIHLSGIEQSLLYLLASRPGSVVTKEEILDAIWGTDFVAESNIVNRHVRSLRIKLQDDYRNPRFIATVPGQGYRFVPTFSKSGWTMDGTRARPRPDERRVVITRRRQPCEQQHVMSSRRVWRCD